MVKVFLSRPKQGTKMQGVTGCYRMRKNTIKMREQYKKTEIEKANDNDRHCI